MGLKKPAFFDKFNKEKTQEGKKGRFHLQALNIVVLTLCVVLVGSLFLTHTQAGNMLLTHLSQPTASSEWMSLESKPGGGPLSTEQVATRILPAVVGIVQYQKGALSETGEGSGIIMSKDGRILTNNHVVEGANRLDVVLRNGRHYAAKLVGTDARTDLAILKINALNLSCAQFGDSGQCRVGEQVVAVGNPSGLELAGSVTQGIISALNRNVDVGNGPMNLIQTDAAINPGNSGGALVNMYGQVIGINSAKIAQSGYEGLGFSIPIRTAKPVVDSILRYGYVKGRTKFGLKCREIDTVTAQVNHIPQGLYVGYVEPGSSAEKNGVKVDDIITAVDGQPVKTTDDLIGMRDKHKPGDTLQLTIFRRGDGKTYLIPVTLLEDKGIASDADGSW